MRSKRSLCVVRLWMPLIVAGGLSGLVLTGCGKKVPYPEPKVTSPLGRPGECAHCGKEIESVREDHLVVFNGIQYVVCDEKCADGVKEWLKKLDGR